MTAQDIIAALGLSPHREGGHYVQTFRDEAGEGAYSTAIYYLLQKGERSHWHRVHKSSEVWHYYAGDPIIIAISRDGRKSESHVLGPDILAGERPQIVVPAGWWQSARSDGAWSLAGCTVAPGFDFANFEMAPAGWQPGSKEQ